jgi:molybdate transport system regulatory protein
MKKFSWQYRSIQADYGMLRTMNTKQRTSPATPPPGAVDANMVKAPRRPNVRFRMRVLLDDHIALGPGKVTLLEAIRTSGSISGAARNLGMSYRRAWLLIDELNRLLGEPATVSTHGGSSRGGCVLTPVGEEIVRLYRDIETQAYAHCQSQIRTLSTLFKTTAPDA